MDVEAPQCTSRSRAVHTLLVSLQLLANSSAQLLFTPNFWLFFASNLDQLLIVHLDWTTLTALVSTYT